MGFNVPFKKITFYLSDNVFPDKSDRQEEREQDAQHHPEVSAARQQRGV